MKHLSQLSSLKKYLIGALLLAAALYAAQEFRKIGYRDSPDSSWYLLVADSFSQGTFERNPRYAPLYSWSLGTLHRIGFTYYQCLTVYMFFIFFGLLWVAQHIFKNIIFTFLFFVAFWFCSPTYEAFHFIWTEPGYSLIILSATVFLLNILKSKDASHYPFLISLGLLPLQRYIGGYMAVYLGLLYLLLDVDFHGIKKRTFRLAIAAFPAALILLFNYLRSGGIAGDDRDPSTMSFMQNASLMWEILELSFPFERSVYLLALVIALALAIMKKWHPLYFLALATPLIQMIVQLHSSSVYRFDALSPRFIVPIIPLAYFAIFYIIQQSLLLLETSDRSWLQRPYVTYVLLAAITYGSYSTLEEEFASMFSINNRKYVRETKSIVATAPSDSTIGIYTDRKRLTAAWVLLSRIQPKSGCKNYRISSSIFADTLEYKSNCKNMPGPTYVSIESPQDVTTLEKVDYLIVDLRTKHKEITAQLWNQSLPRFHTVSTNPVVLVMKKR